MGARKIIPVGTPFERLTVTGDGGQVEYGAQGRRCSVSHCECECGTKVTIRNDDLVSGHTTSCGCWRQEVSSAHTTAMSTKHGQANRDRRTPEYRAWCGMTERTTNPRNPNWDRYGGRGIKVCERWLKFENFYEDMGDRPTPQHSLDRIDNDGNYCPENCRWATRVEQQNNQSSNVRFVFYGLSKTIAEWSRITLVPADMIRDRLRRAWPPQFAVWAPPESRLKDLLVKYPHHRK